MLKLDKPPEKKGKPFAPKAVNMSCYDFDKCPQKLVGINLSVLDLDSCSMLLFPHSQTIQMQRRRCVIIGPCLLTMGATWRRRVTEAAAFLNVVRCDGGMTTDTGLMTFSSTSGYSVSSDP